MGDLDDATLCTTVHTGNWAGIDWTKVPLDDLDHPLNPEVVALEVQMALDQGDHELLYSIGLRFFQLQQGDLLQPTCEMALAKSADGETLLHDAAECASVIALERLLAAGADVNAANVARMIPLHVACWHGHLGNVETLLRSGADPKALDFKCRPPLWYACKKGHVGVVGALLQTGCVNVNAPLAEDGTALQLACAGGHLDLVRFLIDDAKADVSCSSYSITRNDSPPLHIAARLCQKEIVQYLVDVAHVDPNAAYDSWTPLDLAMTEGDDESVMCYLFNRMHLGNLQGVNHVILRAVQYGRIQFLDHLIQVYSLGDQMMQWRDFDAGTLLFYVRSKETTQFLVTTVGIDANVRNDEGETALLRAVDKGREDVVMYLIEDAGVIVDLPDAVPRYRASPFVRAVVDGHLNVAKRMLEYLNRLGVTVSDDCWRFMFCAACQEGRLNVVQWLLSLDKSTFVGLRYALDANHFIVAEWLVFEAGFSLVDCASPGESAPRAVHVSTSVDRHWSQLSKTKFKEILVRPSVVAALAKWLLSLENVRHLYLDAGYVTWDRDSLLKLEAQMSLSHLEVVDCRIHGLTRRQQPECAAALERIARHPVLNWNVVTRNAWWSRERHCHYPKALRDMIETLLILARRTRVLPTNAPIWALSDSTLYFLFGYIGCLRYWPSE